MVAEIPSPAHPLPRAGASRLTAPRIALGLYLTYGITALAAWLWPGEEPGKLQTMTVAVGVTTAAVLMILFAHVRQWIAAPESWIMVFTGKFCLSLFITYYFWFEPLEPDLLRLPVAVVGSQDSNLYDYYALAAAQRGILESWDLLNFTWLSFGITAYLASIYRFLGVSIAYVSMCNALLSVAGLVMLSATLRILFGRERRWDRVALATFIPSIAYYDATPAKEPLTHVLFYFTLFFATALLWRRRVTPGSLLKVIFSLGLLAAVRANVAIMLVVTNSWPALRRIGLWRALALCALCTGLTILTLGFVTGTSRQFGEFFSVNDRFQQAATFVQERADAGEGGLKQAVAENLAPRNVGHLLLWSPVRTVIWLYLPYPLLVPNFDGIDLQPSLLYEARLRKVAALHEVAFALTGWLLILATPYMLGAALAVLQRRLLGLQLLLLNILGPAFLIGNLMFLMGRRYRTLFEPLVLAVVLVAIHHGLARRFALPVWLFLTFGVGLVSFLSR